LPAALHAAWRFSIVSLRDALNGAAMEGEDRTFHIGGDVERVLWRQLARFAVGSVPRNRGLQIRIAGGIHPSHPAAPAEADTASFAVSALPDDLA
jgi:hypothetical protein